MSVHSNRQVTTTEKWKLGYVAKTTYPSLSWCKTRLYFLNTSKEKKFFRLTPPHFLTLCGLGMDIVINPCTSALTGWCLTAVSSNGPYDSGSTLQKPHFCANCFCPSWINACIRIQGEPCSSHSCNWFRLLKVVYRTVAECRSLCLSIRLRDVVRHWTSSFEFDTCRHYVTSQQSIFYEQYCMHPYGPIDRIR